MFLCSFCETGFISVYHKVSDNSICAAGFCVLGRTPVVPFTECFSIVAAAGKSCRPGYFRYGHVGVFQIPQAFVRPVLVGLAINAGAHFVIKPYYTAFTQNSEIIEYDSTYMQICVLHTLIWLMNRIFQISGVWIAFHFAKFIVFVFSLFLVRRRENLA